MKAEYSILFQEESGKLSDGTRWAVCLESWYAEPIMNTGRKYVLLAGTQHFTTCWEWSSNIAIEIWLDGNPAYLIRRAIQVYDELVGAKNGSD